ncbi:caspase family protein [Bradyrhizobium liaoningense]|uniref:caspase family protein n=1 Tax=Bradyrhizobium liaoningense TaxID=43992 RepID=UPI001BA5C1A0|nr:caspase family protein [Bradyrhizobium liaoningense]MBR0718852.1 caspase family protein [Bradyrhizobium liaoningense]
MFRLKSLLMTASVLGSLFGFACDPAFAQVAPAQAAPVAPAIPVAQQSPEQRVALVIGNSNYRNAPQLANPDNDAESMAKFLNSAGFEVISATDLTQSDMLKVVQDFSAKVASRGTNTVAMVYYAGHGVQLAGENYLVPVDAKVSSPSELVNNSVRLVDVMSTLETIPSRMRIVILDACRNNPFPSVNDAGRGLAIVDAPNGSIVGYSTAPGSEALDGQGGHSPYTQAFLNIAREPNLPIEQLFKRVRLEVNQTTDGAQVPWESSSLTSDFTFFGDTAVAANRAPIKAPVVQMASNLPSRSARQAYDYVLSEGQPQYYQEFIQMYPHDPLCDRIRWLLANLLIANAWHKTVLANSPIAYKNFYDSYSNSPYAQSALKLQLQPKEIPLMQATHFLAPQNIAPLKVTNLGPNKYLPIVQQGGGLGNGNLPVGQNKPIPIDSNVIGKLGNGGQNGGQVTTLPAGNNLPKQPIETPSQVPGKVVTLPAPTNTTTGTPSNTGVVGKIVTLPAGNNTPNTGSNSGTPGKIVTLPATNVGKGGTKVDVKNIDVKTNGPATTGQNQPIRVTTGNTGIVKQTNNNPVPPVQVNRPQFNTTPNRINNVTVNNNFKQSMNQAPAQNGGNMNRRGGFMH